LINKQRIIYLKKQKKGPSNASGPRQQYNRLREGGQGFGINGFTDS